MVFPEPSHRITGLEYGFVLTCGVALAIIARIIWRCRLADEIIRAIVSRGNPPQYRHHIRWRR